MAKSGREIELHIQKLEQQHKEKEQSQARQLAQWTSGLTQIFQELSKIPILTTNEKQEIQKILQQKEQNPSIQQYKHLLDSLLSVYNNIARRARTEMAASQTPTQALSQSAPLLRATFTELTSYQGKVTKMLRDNADFYLDLFNQMQSDLKLIQTERKLITKSNENEPLAQLIQNLDTSLNSEILVLQSQKQKVSGSPDLSLGKKYADCIEAYKKIQQAMQPGNPLVFTHKGVEVLVETPMQTIMKGVMVVASASRALTRAEAEVAKKSQITNKGAKQLLSDTQKKEKDPEGTKKPGRKK